MKIVIAGCRDFCDYDAAKEFILRCLEELDSRDITIISGGCSGADRLGERFAKEFNTGLEIYNAEWEKYGRAAGPIRNRKMAELCDMAICFWDGQSRGTASMIRYAEGLGRIVKIKKI